MSLLIKNGKIADDKRVYKGDILISDGKIIDIGQGLEGEEIFDAGGRMVLPGGIDVHTHFDLDLGQYVAVDDFYTGTRAAAYGGTTAIVDHIGFGPRGCSLMSMIDHYHELAGDKAVIDYSFHGVIQDVTEHHLKELEDLKEAGIPSLKLYTTYGGMLSDNEILRVLKKAKETGTVVCVHCENDGAIKQLRQEATDANNLDPIYHAKTRPAETEAEAINRMIYLSEIAGCPKLYIVHVSSQKGLNEIIQARKRGVKNLYCETCTQYLVLDQSRYEAEDGVKYIMSPPLREKSDQEALWAGIMNGDVDVVATDHCPFYYERDKLPHKDNFTTCPGGAPGVEERMEIVLSEGLERKIPIEKLIQVLVNNPAKIFGLYPQKGQIEKGADADLVIYEDKEYEIKQENRHSAVDYTNYEGFRPSLKVSTVISNGKIILKDGEFLGNKSDGKFIKRKI